MAASKRERNFSGSWNERDPDPRKVGMEVFGTAEKGEEEDGMGTAMPGSMGEEEEATIEGWVLRRRILMIVGRERPIEVMSESRSSGRRSGVISFVCRHLMSKA